MAQCINIGTEYAYNISLIDNIFCNVPVKYMEMQPAANQIECFQMTVD